MAQRSDKIRRTSEGVSLRWLRNIIILIITGFLLWKILPPLKGIIIMFVLALLFAYLLEPLVYHLENRGLKRTYSIIILYCCIAFILYIAGYFLFNPVKTEIGDLIQTIRSGKIYAITDRIKEFITVNFPFIHSEQIDATLQESFTTFQNEVLGIAQRLLSYIQGVFSLVTQIFIIPLIAFFILKDGPRLKRDVISLIPNSFFEMSLHLLYKLDQQIGRYIRGQVLDTLILAILYSIGFYALGVPFYIVMGAFSGIANIIPYVGPVFAAIPPILVLVIETESLALVPVTIALFVVIQLFEVVFIQPTVVAKSVDIHPLILIFSVLAGGQILGIIGMLFAVLLAGIIKVIIVEFAWCYKNYRFSRM